MNNVIDKKIYAELAEIFRIQPYISNKIPRDILTSINSQAQLYEFELGLDNSDIINTISKEAFCLYTFLYTKYIADKPYKEKIKQILLTNDKNIRQKNNPDDIFKSKSLQIEQDSSNTSIIEYHEPFFTKIKNWIKKFFS